MRKLSKKSLLISCMFMAISLSGCCFHEWKDATCTNAKTCKKCGETEGKSLGHEENEWEIVDEASQNTIGLRQITCNRCGEILEEEPIYYYEFTEEEQVLYTNVLDTYNSLKEIHLNPDSFELLGASTFADDHDRTTIHISFLGSEGDRLSDYFWKDIDDDLINNLYGKDNYIGTIFTTEKLDIDKILYFEQTDLYEPTILPNSCIEIE